MGHANVEYEISGMGITDTSILKALPGPQIIRQNTMKDIDKSFSSIKAKLAALNISKLLPEWFMVRVEDPGMIDPTLEAQAVAFSYRQVADRSKLGEAVNAAESLGLKPEAVKKVYKDKFGIIGLTQKMTQESRKLAQKWLDI